MKLEDVLQQRGLVNEAQVAAATAEAARTNTPTAFVLISQGFVSEQDVYDAQRAQASAGPAVPQPDASTAPGVPPTNVAAELHAPVTPGVPSAPTTPTEALNDGPASPPPPPFSPLTANLAPATAVAPTEPTGNGHAPEIAPIDAPAFAHPDPVLTSTVDAPAFAHPDPILADSDTSTVDAPAFADPDPILDSDTSTVDAPAFADPDPAPARYGSGRFDANDLPMTEAAIEEIAQVEVVEELKEPNLADFMVAVADGNGSDLHVTAGLPPMIRVHGDLKPLKGYRVLQPKDLQEMLYSMITQKQREIFEENLELDFSYALPGRARFRVNVFQQRDALGAVMRLIPFEIKKLEELGAPSVIREFAHMRRGLVLVTGITGSGKSTTLAALIDVINAERAEHIMTVEDPIEFLHKHKKAIVNQREVGTDTHGFGAALKHVLRQDPDVILVGEMRDLETIQTALTAAETGHLVFGTLHTQDAPQSVDRIIDVFPPHQQAQIRVQLASTLAGIVSQQLVPVAEGKGRALAAEILMVTPAVANLIREGKTHQIYTSMQAGGKYGMQVMDQHLAELVKLRVITYEMALERCHREFEFKRLVGRA
jgi:twitching motility protein PilT